MTTWQPDPTFYPSPRDAAEAPAETLAYVTVFDREARRPDAIAVIDTDPCSGSYPDGVGAWMAKADSGPDGFTLDERFFPYGDAFRGLRAHQIRLQGGDASSDSYCFQG
ncbi:MAG: hypothetical protein GEV11_14205 [Streptosporangiales bacterium]|nr:hypothetical protein [Streptosporangiales bacterium]